MSQTVTKIVRLGIQNFRNIALAELSFGARFNVVYGDNGQGKTNLLEAAYVACTSKSFRASKLSEVLSRPAVGAMRVHMVSESLELSTTKQVEVEGSTRRVQMDGHAPESMYMYAARTPVVVFHPQELNLSMGPAALRRRLLDRVALYAEPSSVRVSAEYKRAMKARQTILASRSNGDPTLDAFEEVAAVRAIEMRVTRTHVTETLSAHAARVFSELGVVNQKFAASYRASGAGTVDTMRAELKRSRDDDRRRGFAASGPHRDDVVLRLDGRQLRGHASQGQHRLAVLSLKIAEMHAIEAATGSLPVLLLDDISSELDAKRTTALFAFLDALSGQVIVTTTRPELVPRGRAERAEMRVEAGMVACVS